MKIYSNPAPSSWAYITRRVTRGDEGIAERVSTILERVRSEGDQALLSLLGEIDGVTLPVLSSLNPSAPLQVSEAEFEQADSLVPPSLKDAIRKAKSNIESFHRAQLRDGIQVETTPGVMCYQRSVPIRRIGLYIPGGSAPLFSTVLMLAVPAKVAGCDDIILCSPPGKDGKISPFILWTARLCGITSIFKAGGAQAIGAMAYGTQSISRRDKIFGPGNRYVMKAKQMVASQSTGIDMPAGPSEVMVVADGSAVPSFIASDLLSQAEHGPDSQAMLVCSSMEIAQAVNAEIDRQLEDLPRRSALIPSLEGSAIVVLPDRGNMLAFANEYAPEHLILSVEDPWDMASGVFTAGSVFIGNYSPESAGDYASGTNHTLPTSGWARSYSGLGVDSFMRKITFQELGPEGLGSLARTICDMALAEGLQAHANAVSIRMEERMKRE